MALSALLLLLPLLLNVQKIPDNAVQSDMNAVDSAISSMNQWQDPRNSLATLEPQLTVAQRALLKMHWEQETVQREKPEAPPQFDLGLFSEALEAMVEMDETAKEVKLRMDKLNEWAGGEKTEKLLQVEEEEEKPATAQKEGQNERTEVRENDEERSIGTVPEVRVKEDGNVVVKSVGGGEGKMEVRRGKDKNGNEEVVVTFVKNEGKQRAQEEVAEAEKKEQEMKAYLANNAKTSVPTPPTSSSSAASVEEEGDKSRWNTNKMLETNGSAIPRRIDGFLTRNGGLNGTVADKVRGRERETEERFENVGMSKNGRDFADGWFYSPPLTNGGPFGSLLNLFFGRKKRETMVRENVQKMEDGRTIRTMEKLITLGKPGSNGFMTKVVDVVMSVDGAGGRQAGNSSTVRKGNWMVKQGGTEGESDGRKTDTAESASGSLLKAAMDENGERNATGQSRTGDGGEQQQQQDEMKAEIKQYLKRCVASTDGQKKWEKLAYVWYSQKLYWTAKWVESLENRVAGVKPELIQQFLLSNTGLAAYKELKDEMDKCEAKLAKLKEWIGKYYR